MPGSVSRMSPAALAAGPSNFPGAAGAGAAGAGAAAGAAGSGAAAGAGASAPPAPVSNTISTWPTGTVSPTLYLSSVTLPALGAPMVTVALSVITSTISWFSATSSPAFTSQLTISPSATPSPISGNLNSNFAMGKFLFAESAARVKYAKLRTHGVEQGRQNPVGKRQVFHLECVRE